MGKSTVSVNLACALARLGLRVGLLDADVYGPSIPRMLGLTDEPVVGAGGKLQPISVFGIKAMSIGLMVDEAAIGDDASMDNIDGWDSLKQMNLVLALEESFGVSIPDEDAGNATSFKLIVLVLEEQLVA